MQITIYIYIYIYLTGNGLWYLDHFPATARKVSKLTLARYTAYQHNFTELTNYNIAMNDTHLDRSVLPLYMVRVS